MKPNKVLLEAKARIEHPEDMIFDQGSHGAKAAVHSLKFSLELPGALSLKFDGSPALIAGCDLQGFTMTDKSGFSKEQFPRSGQELYNEIFQRFPDQPGRKNYSSQLAKMFEEVKKTVPKNFQGFFQFDVLWFSKPDTQNQNFVFQPNKIFYSVPVDSDLGKVIAQSNMGIVIHSYFSDMYQDEPSAVKDAKDLGLLHNSKLAVLNTQMTVAAPAQNNNKLTTLMMSMINKNASVIDKFLDKNILQANKISDLPKLLKSFLAKQAAAGKEVSKTLAQDFVVWINTDNKLTANKRSALLKYISENQKAYAVVCNIVLQIVAFKNQIIGHLSQQQGSVNATLNGEPGHEGYVFDGPSGRIKLVSRPKFMFKGE